MRFMSLAILFFASTSPLLAQVADKLDGISKETPAHLHSDHGANVSESLANMIDGAKHPDLIPDSAAYRLFFIAASEFPNATEDRKKRQRAVLERTGLKEEDLQALIKVLEAFKVQYAALTDRYNASEEAALRIGSSHSMEFRPQRDKFVQTFQDNLAHFLTPDGVARLNGHIQSEKIHMKVSIREEQ